MAERRSWSPEEDKALKYLRDDLKVLKWSEISRRLEFEFHLPGRNGKQCRQRYTNHLDDSIKFDEISPEEEQQLFKLHDIIGNKWSQICRDFHGRTQNQIKNHFHSKLRKAIRKLNKQIKLYFKKSIKALKLNIVYKIVEASDLRFFNIVCLESDVKSFNELKNMLLEFAGGKVSQKSEISILNEKDQILLLLQKIESFERLMKQNKTLLSANKKNKKSLSRKIYSTDKTSISTQNSEISQSQDRMDTEENESHHFCQKNLTVSETGLQIENQNIEKIQSLKTQNKDQSFVMMRKQMITKKIGTKKSQIEFFEEDIDFKTQLKCKKQEIEIPEFIRGIMEEQDLPDQLINEKWLLDNKFSIISYESLIEFEDNYLNESQVNMMHQRFESFSNLQSSLFE